MTRLAALVIAVVALAAVARAAPPPEPAPTVGPRVAILPFDNASGDASLDALGTGIQAMLTTDLSAVSSLTLVERARLAAIQGELALGQTAAIDPATAGKVGKLAGATHLVAGALTVAGPAMRLDARLFDVTTGEVVVTAKIEGERDAFFELEKQLVQQMIDALQAKVSAKERAQVARIHTSDFSAFEKFSQGVFDFDRQRYDEALSALKQAAAMDEEFKLARLTLDDYTDLIGKLRARAALLDASARKQQALEANARAREQQGIIDDLWKVARTTGDEHRLDRLAAITRLAMMYGAIDGATTSQMELRKILDRWWMERTADALCQAYAAEAPAVWPKVPLWIEPDVLWAAPYERKDYAEDERSWLDHFFGTRERTTEVQRRNELMDSLDRHESFAGRLHLDIVGYARLAERGYELGLKLDPDAVDVAYGRRPHNWRVSYLRSLGELMREAGLFDESTRYLSEAGRLSEDADRVKWIAQDIERNKEIVAFLAAHPSPVVREWMMLRRWDIPKDDFVKVLSEKPLSPGARSSLASLRDLRVGDHFRYVLIGDVPVWGLEGSFFRTGPRSDPRRAASLDYYRTKTRSAEVDPWIAMVGGRPLGSLDASFEVAYTPRADWWHDSLSSSAADLASAGFISDRPEVVFLFGVEDVDVDPKSDPDGSGVRLQRGLHGFGLRLAGGEATLVEATEAEVRNGHWLDRYRLAYKVLDTAAVTGDRLAVRVKVDGKKVSATVGGKTLSTTLDAAPSGFNAFAMLRPGYVGIEKLAIKSR